MLLKVGHLLNPDEQTGLELSVRQMEQYLRRDIWFSLHPWVLEEEQTQTVQELMFLDGKVAVIKKKRSRVEVYRSPWCICWTSIISLSWEAAQRITSQPFPFWLGNQTCGLSQHSGSHQSVL